jgi:hypothetical protein
MVIQKKFNRCIGLFFLQILLIWQYLHGIQVDFVQQGKVAAWTVVDQPATVVRK